MRKYIIVARKTAAVLSVEIQTRIVIQRNLFFFFGRMLVIFQSEILVLIMTEKFTVNFLA